MVAGGHAEISAGTGTVDVGQRMDSRRMGLMARLAYVVVRAYQYSVAGRPSPCRFIPSCSNYALDALESYGLMKGVWLILCRLCRCHPWGGAGLDPVQPHRTEHEHRLRGVSRSEGRSQGLTRRRQWVIVTMFDPVFDVVTAILAWFYQLWPSYGMSIVFLTLMVMVITTPLTMKSTRTMMEMQLLAPELKKIQQKHRGDRVELNKAQMAFYQEHGLNPMGGCLPILVQAPIFLVLYRVVMGLTRRATTMGNQLGQTVFHYGAGGRGNHARFVPI